MPKARVKSSAQIAAAKRNLEKARRAKRSKPQGRSAMLSSQMDKLDKKKNKTAADQKKLGELYSRYKTGRSGGGKAVEARAKRKAADRAAKKEKWKYPKYTPLSGGVGYEQRQRNKTGYNRKRK